MKKIKAMLLTAVAAIALQACDNEPEQLPGGDDPVEVDDCPEGVSQNGEPCK